MKSLMLVCALLLSNVSFAQNGERNLEFTVTESNFSPLHVQNPGAAQVVVNFAQSKVVMSVEQRWHCPEGKMCAAVMPPPVVVDLPITSIENVECGIRMITAQVDMRPVDGVLEVLKVEDASKMTCPTFAPYKARAWYSTKVYDRFKGMEVAAESTMVIEAAATNDPQPQIFKMSEGTFKSGFSMFEKPADGTMQIEHGEVVLNIDVRLNCGAGKPCPRYLPRPLRLVLPIVSVKKLAQGELIRAENVVSKDGTRETMEILDLRNCETCDLGQYKQLKVEYKAEITTSKGPTQRTGTFYFY